MEIWDLWYPDSGATGLSFARGRLDPTDVLWVHAAPPSLNVTVRDGEERVVASGKELPRVGKRLPLTRLARQGDTVSARTAGRRRPTSAHW